MPTEASRQRLGEIAEAAVRVFGVSRAAARAPDRPVRELPETLSDPNRVLGALHEHLG